MFPLIQIQLGRARSRHSLCGFWCQGAQLAGVVRELAWPGWHGLAGQPEAPPLLAQMGTTGSPDICGDDEDERRALITQQPLPQSKR